MPAEDRYIVLLAKGTGAPQLREGGKSVSCCLRKADLPKNCSQTFEGGGLYARRPVVCVPLTRQHRTARLQWCREHHNWTEQDWACVLSDESRIVQTARVFNVSYGQRRSPDLNPIENVWDALGRQVAGRNYPPTNKNTLIRALTEEWDKLPQQLLDNVVQSMVRRVEFASNST
ncbi:hypothetical protein TNCV_2320501 [Trichonephila clavipes]|nr:hypothetical protein TNCV_2320501 [Trichonephila clavipes]